MSYFFQSSAFDFPNKSRNIVAGGWKELGRTTLGSAGDIITVSSLANKRYYMVLTSLINSASINHNLRQGNGSADSSALYADRESQDGGADATTNTQTSANIDTHAGSYPKFSVGHISNYSANEKLNMFNSVGQNTAGVGNAPNRQETVSKYVFTTNPIDVIQALNTDTGDYNTDSEVVVLGYDPTDTHTTNFWEELDSKTQGSSDTTFNSNTFTAKKYLWIQGYFIMSAGNPRIQFNSDTTALYAQRSAINGSESSFNTLNQINMFGDFVSPGKLFFNIFIINTSAQEKLCTGNVVWQSTAGAGTAPSRVESVGKWANTSAQITSIQFNTSAGNINIDSFYKIWGSN